MVPASRRCSEFPSMTRCRAPVTACRTRHHGHKASLGGHDCWWVGSIRRSFDRSCLPSQVCGCVSPRCSLGCHASGGQASSCSGCYVAHRSGCICVRTNGATIMCRPSVCVPFRCSSCIVGFTTCNKARCSHPSGLRSFVWRWRSTGWSRAIQVSGR